VIGSISGIHQVGRTIGKDVFLTQQVALVGFEDMLHVNLTSPLSLMSRLPAKRRADRLRG
jgi:hypothetical protein